MHWHSEGDTREERHNYQLTRRLEQQGEQATQPHANSKLKLPTKKGEHIFSLPRACPENVHDEKFLNAENLKTRQDEDPCDDESVGVDQ